MATIAILAERVLRRLGVAVVPASQRPANAATVTVIVLANRALQTLGVPVPKAEQSAAPTTIPGVDLVTRALQMLGVIAAEEAPTAADATVATLATGAVFDELTARGIVDWPITAIPRAVAEDTCLLVALHLATAFGKQADPTQRPVLEDRIRQYSMLKRSQALAEARVLSIHAGLVAQGVASWTDAQIPAAVADDYTALTVLEMAPMFGGKSDLAAVPVIEQRIRRYSVVLGAPAVAVEKLMAVHAGLDARGKARWSSQDIPDQLEHSYVEMAAVLAAPEFGVPPDPKGWAVGEMMINRYIALPTSGETVRAIYF